MSTDYHQYRITVNGSVGPVLNRQPSVDWFRAAQACEDRGGLVRLERRLVTSREILPLLADRSGWIAFGKTAVSPWEVFAEVEA